MITEGKLEDRKSRQALLIPQSWFSRDSGETYYYDNPYYSMFPSDDGEPATFNNQARVPNIRPIYSSSPSMYPAGKAFCCELFLLYLACNQ